MTDQFNTDADSRLGFVDEADNPSEQTTTALAYQLGVQYFSLQGYRLTPDMAGQFAFHRVYRLARPKKHKGVTYPEDFKVWKQVANQSEITRFQAIVQDYIQTDYKGRQLWMPIIQPDPSHRKPLYAHAQSLVSLQTISNKQTGEPISYGLDPYPRLCTKDESPAEIAPRAFVPLSEWFAPQLHQLTIHHLLSLFPEAERHLLALCIGRATVGRNNAVTPSGLLVSHTSRMAALVLGKDPGLGKSTLFDKLWHALEGTGYIVETFSKMGAQFNMGSVATADIIYKDDISTKGLKAFVESENTKIIITGNGLLRCEDKGTNAVNVQPTGVIFLNANEFSPTTVYGIDPGTADRLKIISTLRKSELIKYPVQIGSKTYSAYPEIFFKELAHDLKVSEAVLMLYLARLCTDYFWETIQREKESRINKLKEAVHYWTHRLRVPLHKNASAQVMSLYTMVILGNLNPTQVPRKLAYTDRQDVSVSVMPWKSYLGHMAYFCTQKESLPFQAFLRWHFENIEPTNEYHPYLGLRIVSGPHLLQAFRETSTILEHAEIVCNIFEEIKLAQGLPLSKDYVWLNESWQTITPLLRDLLKLWGIMADVTMELFPDAQIDCTPSEHANEHLLKLDQMYTEEVVNKFADVYNRLTS